MSRLNKTESGQVMRMMETPGWDALTTLVAATINDLNSRTAGGTNAFEVLRSLHMREGKVAGLREFFEGLERGESLSEEATKGARP